MRIDRLIWYLRFAKSRVSAQTMVQDGHIRVNGKRVERAHSKISAGDVLTIPMAENVRIIELIVLPARRGPASEAQSCYRVLDEGQGFPIAASGIFNAAEKDLQP